MRGWKNGIEPTFEEDSGPKQEGTELPPWDFGSEASETRFAVRVVSVVVIATCLFFVGDRLYTRYQEYQAVKEIEHVVNSLASGFSESVGQAGAALAEVNRQAAARAEAAVKKQQERIQQQRSKRLATTEGYWLSKNCSDWTRAWNELKAETAAREMKTHCDRLERYLATGIPPSGIPRAGGNQR